MSDLLAVQQQYVVLDSVDAISAVESIISNMYGWEKSTIDIHEPHKLFRAKNVDFYVQKLNTSDYLVFVTSKLTMKL